MAYNPPETIPLSTYTKYHKKYYEKYKPLILARNKKYKKAYKARWYMKNRDKILAEMKEKRDEERIRRLVEREKILQTRENLHISESGTHVLKNRVKT